MTSPKSSDSWLSPFLAASVLVIGLVVLCSPPPPARSPRAAVAATIRAKSPEAKPTPAPTPTPEPTPMAEPPAEPVVDPVAQAEEDAKRAALVEEGLKGIRFPPIPLPFLAFWRERGASIIQGRELHLNREVVTQTKPIVWPEAMPRHFRSLVLPGNIETQVRFFAAGQAGPEATQMDYVAEALVPRADGQRGVARWVVAIRFFESEEAAKRDFSETVADLEANEGEEKPTPVELGDEAVQGEISVGVLGQRERLYVVREGQQVLEMRASASSPPEVHPKAIVESLQRLE